MFKTMSEMKVMRDPIHEYIHVDKQLIWDCINAPEFQRLRRIHQLGPAMYVYHSAEHSRFSHSLGVYEITRRIINEVIGVEHLSELDQMSLLCAALLHDIGHGPFSHTFENLLQIRHERFTIALIQGDSSIHELLKVAHPELPQAIVDILKHQHPNPLLSQVISGQLDADRMDYLLRDAYFSGTSYGKFDLERMFRTMRVVNDTLVIKKTGVHTIEDYILARYHMYWQVYFHPISRSVEALLQSYFKRLKHLYQDKQLANHLLKLHPFLSGGPISNAEFLMMDESTFLHLCKQASTLEDPIAADLAQRILNRDLFDYVDITNGDQVEVMRAKVKAAGFDEAYYLVVDEAKQTPYFPYAIKEQASILIADEANNLMELSHASNLVKAITLGKEKEDKKVFFPRSIR